LAYQRGVFWGVVPYAPAAPFLVKFLRSYEDVPTAGELAREFRKRDIAGEVPFSVDGKLRPILALSEPSEELREITALRLANITRRVRQRHLSQDEADAVVAGTHRYLFPLRPEVVSSLTQTAETYAVIIDSPVVLHASAITTSLIGEMSEEDFAVVCNRFVRALDLDLATFMERGDR
jgi:predicted nuclease with RNAse H fold